MEHNIKDLIELPPDLLPREEYLTLNSLDKERYVYKVLKKILELNPNGVMISTVVKATKITHSTVWHHFEKMVATREAYKLNYGPAQVYFANGKMVHPLTKLDLNLADKSYSFYIVVNNFGKFVYVQERREDRLGVVSVNGGLLVPLQQLNEFISKLKEVEQSKEVMKYGTTES